MVDDYAGDVSPERAWSVLKEDPRARLVDVRTAAEWNYVGVPDLSTIGRDLGLVEWITFPAGRRNDEFVDQAVMIQRDPDAATFFLCRSGVRSTYAAIAMTRAGYRRCFNVTGGFEGDKDNAGHRGAVNGWKVAGLPWKQG